ncbi:VENN motif pre-toxin domain-containing protein [Stenotrophomonas riyadhensis]|uniref:VENN motif pre-toxin domain-containing protein n=1 Tax=Stenotrophomonas riyadhensis TaxID=2859893 RepID=UPI0021E12C25|nr:VENN motif pre-toxin domain-containing protein [Stenotrophomonas sp. CFS3442]
MVLALAQAVGALAGGLSGQDLAGIALNAGIAKNSVENNWLSRQEIALMESERAACGGKGGDVQACKDSVTRAYDELTELRYGFRLEKGRKLMAG